MRKLFILAVISGVLIGGVNAQQKKAQPKKEDSARQQEALQVLKGGLSTDSRFTWKIEQDEAQRICSQYSSREEMHPQAVQRVIQLSQADIKYPQWDIYMGDWKERSW